MAVVSFSQAPLAPFLGKWRRDAISVSRHKVAKRYLGEEGLKRLWACASIEEMRRCLENDPVLAEWHDRLLALSPGEDVKITQRSLAFQRRGFPGVAASGGNATLLILRSTEEGKTIVLDTSDAITGRKAAYVLRASKHWLLMSERYYGRQALFFPKSPMFRYYKIAESD